MKKLVSLVLVALMLSGAVSAFAGLNDIVIQNYTQGDVGGQYSAQIDKAIGSGGARTGAPLPTLPWQAGAQYGTWSGMDLQILIPVAEEEVPTGNDGLTPEKAIDEFGFTKLSDLTDYIEDLMEIYFLAGEEFLGGFYKVGNVTYFVGEDGAPKKVTKNAEGKYQYYDDTTGTPKLYVWVAGTGENDPGSLKSIISGSTQPTATPTSWAPTAGQTQAPANITAGFYTNSSNQVFQVSSSGAITGPYTMVGTLCTANSGTTVWNGTNWETRTGASEDKAIAKVPDKVADQIGYYTQNDIDYLYWAPANDAGTRKLTAVFDNAAAAGAAAGFTSGTYTWAGPLAHTYNPAVLQKPGQVVTGTGNYTNNHVYYDYAEGFFAVMAKDSNGAFIAVEVEWDGVTWKFA